MRSTPQPPALGAHQRRAGVEGLLDDDGGGRTTRSLRSSRARLADPAHARRSLAQAGCSCLVPSTLGVLTMAVNRTDDEVRAEHLRDMGPQLGPVYSALVEDVSAIHAIWQEHRLLFAKSEARVQLLNETGAHVFRMVQDSFAESVVMGLGRLTCSSVPSSPHTPRVVVGLFVARCADAFHRPGPILRIRTEASRRLPEQPSRPSSPLRSGARCRTRCTPNGARRLSVAWSHERIPATLAKSTE